MFETQAESNFVPSSKWIVLCLLPDQISWQSLISQQIKFHTMQAKNLSLLWPQLSYVQTAIPSTTQDNFATIVVYCTVPRTEKQKAEADKCRLPGNCHQNWEVLESCPLNPRSSLVLYLHRMWSTLVSCDNQTLASFCSSLYGSCGRVCLSWSFMYNSNRGRKEVVAAVQAFGRHGSGAECLHCCVLTWDGLYPKTLRKVSNGIDESLNTGISLPSSQEARWSQHWSYSADILVRIKDKKCCRERWLSLLGPATIDKLFTWGQSSGGNICTRRAETIDRNLKPRNVGFPFASVPAILPKFASLSLQLQISVL